LFRPKLKQQTRMNASLSFCPMSKADPIYLGSIVMHALFAYRSRMAIVSRFLTSHGRRRILPSVQGADAFLGQSSRVETPRGLAESWGYRHFQKALAVA